MRQELDFTTREDRLAPYVKPLLKAFVFGEFSDAFLAKAAFPAELAPVMRGVPVPLRQGDLALFAGSKGLAPDILCENMIRVMACDPHFEYVPQYLRYIGALFDSRRMQQSLLGKAQKELEEEQFTESLLHARGALLLAGAAGGDAAAGNGDSADSTQPGTPAGGDLCEAAFAYALVTRAMYEQEQGENTEYVGRFKAESSEFLEIITVEWPDFAPAHYYLGYAYANLGLYRKAQLAWQEFLELAEAQTGRDDMPMAGSETVGEENTAGTGADTAPGSENAGAPEIEEIRARLKEIAEPVLIEDGINDAQAARYDSAIRKLEPFLEGQFAGWWPLHYFLGISYVDTGSPEKALDAFKRVLRLNPSHIGTLDELAALYTALGDAENAEKYQRKAAIVKAGLSEE